MPAARLQARTTSTRNQCNAWISNPRPEVSEVFRVSINIG